MNLQGTTTSNECLVIENDLIPYLEPAGNYNNTFLQVEKRYLIPYLEPAGNYNETASCIDKIFLIPYLEPAGNYN